MASSVEKKGQCWGSCGHIMASFEMKNVPGVGRSTLVMIPV